VGTPCETLGTLCNGDPCKCRKPQLEFRKFENEALETGGDIDGWIPGSLVSLDVCRAECLIRNHCLSITYSPTGECWLKRFTGSIALNNWLTEKKWWIRPEGLISPYVYDLDFLTQDVIDRLRDYVDQNIKFSNAVSKGNSYWDKRIIYYTAIEDPEVKLMMKIVVYRVSHRIRSFFNVSEPVYPETLSLGEWTPGMILQSHGDNSYYPSGEPNYTPRRTWSAILYLNEKFEGGKFYFVGNGTLNLIQPRPGLMIGFGAGPDYFHGVTKVESGRRFTINMWFSNDPRNFLDKYD